MTALVRMRLAGYVRTGRLIGPLVTVLLVFGIEYGGGGQEPAGEAYGASALILFPILVWQTKLLLDAEPDVQRRLAAVAVGSSVREQAAGLAAAVVAALPLVGLALAAPWLVFAIAVPSPPDDVPLASGVMVGVWAHVVLVLPAVALGALASRAVTRSFGAGTMVLVTGAVLSIVLGLKGSPVWWLGPPLMSAARLGTLGFLPGRVVALTADAVLWTAVAAAVYVRIRRVRA